MMEQVQDMMALIEDVRRERADAQHVAGHAILDNFEECESGDNAKDFLTEIVIPISNGDLDTVFAYYKASTETHRPMAVGPDLDDVSEEDHQVMLILGMANDIRIAVRAVGFLSLAALRVVEDEAAGPAAITPQVEQYREGIERLKEKHPNLHFLTSPELIQMMAS